MWRSDQLKVLLRPTTPEEVVTLLLQATRWSQPSLSFAESLGVAPFFDPHSLVALVLLLQLRKAGPAKEKPPADVVGAALRDAGLEITAENVLRALKAGLRSHRRASAAQRSGHARVWRLRAVAARRPARVKSRPPRS